MNNNVPSFEEFVNESNQFRGSLIRGIEKLRTESKEAEELVQKRIKNYGKRI